MSSAKPCLPGCPSVGEYIDSLRVYGKQPEKHLPACPNAEAPKAGCGRLNGLYDDCDKPAPAPEPKQGSENDFSEEGTMQSIIESQQGSEEPIEPVTELEAVKHTNKILRAQLAKAWAETDEARATKDMHKERQEEAWAEVAALHAELKKAHDWLDVRASQLAESDQQLKEGGSR